MSRSPGITEDEQRAAAECAYDRMAWADAPYVLGPESQFDPDVPQGRVREYCFAGSAAFPRTRHRCWTFVPRQGDGAWALPLMVFLDGALFAASDGPFRAITILNNLIAKQEIPPMAALFVDGGERSEPRSLDTAPDGSPLLRGLPTITPTNTRRLEYEPFDARFANFLVQDLLPRAMADTHISIDPDARGIAGLSSGAIGAFTAAWHRPDQFRKVFGGIGSFMSEGAGPDYPSLVREGVRRPLRILLQGGSNDASLPEFGVGEERHRDFVAALEARNYDVRYELGQGRHSSAHMASILPEGLRWLWRDARLGAS